MEEKTSNVNVVLKTDASNDDPFSLTLSFATVWAKIKRYLLPWLIAAVLSAAVIVLGVFLFSDASSVNSLNALISFNYTGIDEGLDPNGNTFDVYEVVSPKVVESALTELGMDTARIESVRASITISGKIPSDIYDQMVAYQSIMEMENSNALAAAENMLKLSYYPTQYTITMDYGRAGMKLDEGEQVLNKILDCYRDYFFERYGYNEALGNAVSALDYTQYDYSEALDIFDSSLRELQDYVDSLKRDDTTRYRSSDTGYTFADLSSTMDTFRTVDLEMISSYVDVYNITKDKDLLITYYQYRVESLNRSKAVQEEHLEALQQSLDAYEKDTIMVIAGEAASTTFGQNSDAYDELIESKISSQTTVAEYEQKIKYYQDRISKLKNSVDSSSAQIERVEKDLAALNEKFNGLVDLVNRTADEYYENVTYARAYKVLVPANGSTINELVSSVQLMMKPLLIVEILLFLIFACVVVITAISHDYNKLKKAEEDAKKAQAASDENA